MAIDDRPLLWRYRDSAWMQVARVVVAVGALVLAGVDAVDAARTGSGVAVAGTAVFTAMAAIQGWAFVRRRRRKS